MFTEAGVRAHITDHLDGAKSDYNIKRHFNVIQPKNLALKLEGPPFELNFSLSYFGIKCEKMAWFVFGVKEVA